MFLPDAEIKSLVERGGLRVQPFDVEIVGSNGLDLRLGREYAILLSTSQPLSAETYDEERYFEKHVSEDVIRVLPNTHYLFTTLEYLEMPNDLIGLLGLRSTYARLGFTMPMTVVDAGFKGNLTIQVRSGPFPVEVRVGERFFHMVVAKLSSKAEREYSGKYKGLRGLALPRL